jgi:hypothetical protein
LFNERVLSRKAWRICLLSPGSPLVFAAPSELASRLLAQRTARIERKNTITFARSLSLNREAGMRSCWRSLATSRSALSARRSASRLARLGLVRFGVKAVISLDFAA